MKEGARIGEVAVEAGVNIQTLRFYERRGLLEEPPRQASGYRAYPLGSVRRIRFIKRAQQLGFTLTEVEDLLRLRDAPTMPCKQVRAAAETKIADIDEKIRRLEAMRRALGSLVKSCAENRKHHCPLLESLDEIGVRTGRRGPGSASQ